MESQKVETNNNNGNSSKKRFQGGMSRQKAITRIQDSNARTNTNGTTEDLLTAPLNKQKKKHITTDVLQSHLKTNSHRRSIFLKNQFVEEEEETEQTT